MQFLIENWCIVVVMLVIVAACVISVWRFTKLPNEEQIIAVKEWLVGVVVKAERELGGGTGVLKLRQVYDLFVARFPWLAKVVPFTTFAVWVDEALVVMREMLAQNKAVKSYVDGKEG